MALSREDVRFGVVPGIARLGEVLANAFSRQQDMTMNLELERLRLGAKQAKEGQDKGMSRGEADSLRKEFEGTYTDIRDETKPPELDEFGDPVRRGRAGASAGSGAGSGAGVPGRKHPALLKAPTLHADPLASQMDSPEGQQYGFMSMGEDWQAVGERESGNVERRHALAVERELPMSMELAAGLNQAIAANVVYPEEIPALAPNLQRLSHALAAIEQDPNLFDQVQPILAKVAQQGEEALNPYERRLVGHIERRAGVPIAALHNIPEVAAQAVGDLIQKSQQRRRFEMAQAMPGQFVTVALQGLGVEGVDVGDGEARTALELGAGPGGTAVDPLETLSAYAHHVANAPEANGPLSFAAEQASMAEVPGLSSGGFALPPEQRASASRDAERHALYTRMDTELARSQDEGLGTSFLRGLGAAVGLGKDGASYHTGRLDTKQADQRYESFKSYWMNTDRMRTLNLTPKQGRAIAIIGAYIPTMGETEMLNIVHADEKQLALIMHSAPEGERRVIQTAFHLSGVREEGSGKRFQTTVQQEEQARKAARVAVKREEFRNPTAFRRGMGRF